MPTPEEQAATIALNLENFNKVKDTPIMATHLTTHGKLYHEQHKGDVFRAAQGEAYGHVDKLLLEILEIERKDNAQTTATLKPILEEYKTLKASKGDNSSDNAAAIEALKKQHGLDLKGVQDLLATSNGEILTLKSSAAKRDTTASLSKGLRGKKFKAHYSNSDIDDLTSLRMAKIVNLAKTENGTQVFYNADGTKRITTSGVNLTAQQVVDLDFADLFAEKAPGGDADQTSPNNNKGIHTGSLENDKLVLNKATIKTREDFYDAATLVLSKAAIANGSEKHTKLYKGAMLEYGYNDLPSRN